MAILHCLVGLMYATGVYSGAVILSPTVAEVTEHENITLTCIYNTRQQQPFSLWTTSSMPGVSAFVANISGTCMTTGFLIRPEYNCDCGENQFSLKHNNVTRTRHGENWTCSVGFTSSNYVTLTVLVPITSITITSPVQKIVTIQENKTLTFVCETSFGRPSANIMWYRSLEKSKEQEKKTNISTTVKTIENGLKKSTSSLSFLPSRSDNNVSLYCTGANVIGRPVIESSHRPTLDVIYPPNDGPNIMNYSNGDTYRIIDQSKGIISCAISGANPMPVLTWICYNGGTGSTADDQLVRTFAWRAVRGTDRRCTCQSSHILTGNQSVYVNVQILYPPTIPIFRINSTTVSEVIRVIRGNSLNIKCVFSSIPSPNLYRWIRSGSFGSVDTQILTLNSIETTDNGEYICEAQNTMTPSSRETVTGISNASINLNVLYAPITGVLEDKSVVEHSSFTVMCPYTSGNPASTVIRWIRENDVRQWNNQDLMLYNVSRTDDMQYVCMVTKIMKPTKGPKIYGNSSASFHLNVMYKSSISSFLVPGFENQNIITVDEGTDVTFNCLADANPKSEMTLFFMSTFIETWSSTDPFTHILRNVTYLESGIYICAGQNKYNRGQPSTRNISLLVRCRHKAFGAIEENIPSSMYASATFSFNVLVYPFLQTNGYQWRHLDGLSWKPMTNTSSEMITVATIQTDQIYLYVTQFKLTIINVTESHFGLLYSLLVVNSMGSLTQNFTLHMVDRVRETVFQSTVGAAVAGTVGGAVTCVVLAIGSYLIIRRHRIFTTTQKKLNGTSLKSTDTHNYDDLQHHQNYENTAMVYDSLQTEYKEEQVATETYDSVNQLDDAEKCENTYKELANVNVRQKEARMVAATYEMVNLSENTGNGEQIYTFPDKRNIQNECEVYVNLEIK
ncbi:hemicentin-1-like [Mercenaria mercenaria]|uniref:hemicentin-1-like n=1 Tax=Mercenaria mercenaria TaxID=6596 RepID=UPI00234F88B8|nr:hemicentin-1-like [Mercenaria mercenaria]